MQGLAERMNHYETGVFAALTMKQNELKARGWRKIRSCMRRSKTENLSDT